MSLQKYRADSSETQSDGARVWFADWMGGATLSKITNCRWATLNGEPRLTVYVQGAPDTYFSTPAKARYLGRTVTGYITGDGDGQIVFHHCYFV